MLELGIYHKPETEYCYAKAERVIALRLRTSKRDTLAVRVIYGGKYDFAGHCKFWDMQLSYTDRLYCYYTADIALDDVRLVYVFELTEDGKTYYYSEDGLSESYDFTLNFYNAFQFAYINEADLHRKVSWMETACFYQIFIDRFRRGNFEKDDAYIDLEWGEIPNPKSFAGGDLKGITEKLGYLKELGINALYLTPVFRSISNHKYDIEDYYAIDNMFGSAEDFGELVRQAHANGMRVVLDAVFNHASDRCAQFRDAVERGRASPYFDWFCIRGDAVDTKEINYECFGSCAYMPKWNTSNPEVQRYLLDVALFWIQKYDIDGWRLDVSDEVPHRFWRRFRDEVKAVKADCAIIGENWHDANAYLHGDQYDSIMNYAFTKACLDYFAFGALDARGFAEKLNNLLMRNTDTVNGMMLNLLDSHDTHRFMTQCGHDVKKLECALAVLYLFTGSPCIYYGTEIAMNGGYDPDCRRTMDWAEADKRGTVWRLIRDLAELKKNEPALVNGSIRIEAEGDMLVLERRSGSAGLRLMLNGGDMPIPPAKGVCTNASGSICKNEFVVETFAIE